MSHDERGCRNCGVESKEAIEMGKRMKEIFDATTGGDRPTDATSPYDLEESRRLAEAFFAEHWDTYHGHPVSALAEMLDTERDKAFFAGLNHAESAQRKAVVAMAEAADRSAEAPLNCATHGSLDWPLRRRCRAPNWGGDCIQAKRPAVVEDIDWCRRRADIPGLNQEARDAILWLADHLEAARILNAKDQRSAEATNVSEFSHGFEVAREACIKWVEERCGYANAYAMAGDPATIDPSPCREGAVPVKPPIDVVEVAIAVALKHLFDARKRIEEGDDYLDDGPVANAVRDGIVWIRRARDGYREAQSQCGDGEQNAQCLTGCGRFALWCGPCTEDGENPRRERATPDETVQRGWEAAVWCLSELQVAEKNAAYAKKTLISNLKDRIQHALRLGPYERRARIGAFAPYCVECAEGTCTVHSSRDAQAHDAKEKV